MPSQHSTYVLENRIISDAVAIDFYSDHLRSETLEKLKVESDAALYYVLL